MHHSMHLPMDLVCLGWKQTCQGKHIPTSLQQHIRIHVPEGSNTSLPSFAWSYMEPFGSCMRKTKYKTSENINSPLRKSSMERTETARASKTPFSLQACSSHFYQCEQKGWHGKYYAGRLLCQDAGHNWWWAWQSTAAQVSAQGCHGNEMSVNMADMNHCFALTAMKNIAKIIHSLEMRDTNILMAFSPLYAVNHLGFCHFLYS